MVRFEYGVVMRTWRIIAGGLFLLLGLTSCGIMIGGDGKAYVRFEVEPGVDGGWISLEGFPASPSPGVDYEIGPGTYLVRYILYWHQISDRNPQGVEDPDGYT